MAAEVVVDTAANPGVFAWLSMVVSPAVAAVVSWLLNRNLQTKVRDQGEKLTALETQRVEKLDRRLEKMEDRCVGQAVNAKLDQLHSQSNTILLKMGKLDREMGEVKTKTDETADHITRLHSAFSQHRREDH